MYNNKGARKGFNNRVSKKSEIDLNGGDYLTIHIRRSKRGTSFY